MHKRKRRRRGRAAGKVLLEALERRRLLAAGNPDLTFDQDGHVTFDGGAGSAFTDVKVQDDGKIVTVGQTGIVQQGQFLVPVFGVFRYTLDGQLDQTFGGGDGIADLPQHWDPESRGFQLSLLDDGRIVAGGEVYFGGVAGAARFNADGTPDPTLGNGAGFIEVGLNIHPYPPIHRARVFADPADGRMYIVGGDSSLNSDPTPGIDIFRFNADGTNDTTFANFGGYHFSTWGGIVPEDLAILASGKLLIAGKQLNPSAGALDDFYLRLGTNGFPDPNFGGGDGLVEDSWTGRAARAIVPMPDDSFYVAGGAPAPSSGGGEWSLLARFTESGMLDSSFGDFFSGVRAGIHAYPYQDMLRLEGGQLLAIFNTGSEIGITRLNAEGFPETAFGSGGTTLTGITGNELGLNLAVDPDGRAIVAGSIDEETFAVIARFTGDIEPTSTVTAHVARDLDGDGFRDAGDDTPLEGHTVFVDLNHNNTFEADADKWALSDASGNVTIEDVPAGSYVVMQIVPPGWKYAGPWQGRYEVTLTGGGAVAVGDFLSTAFASSPHLDAGFGSGGRVTIGAGDAHYDHFAGVERLSNGKLIAAGYIGSRFTLARFHADGSPDTTFGPDGRINPALPTNLHPFSSVMALQPDGKILISAVQGNPHVAAVVRFNADGTLDTAFGNGGGRTLTGFNGNYLYGIAVDGLGRIIAASSTNAASTDAIVARLTPSGQLDETFDSDGVVTHDVLSVNDHVYGVTVQGDDKIILTGSTWDNHAHGYLLRLDESGAKDGTFGAGGLAMLDIPRAGGTWEQVVWQDVEVMLDGRIVVGGYAAGGFAAARYTSAGALDPTFAAGAGYAIAYFDRPSGGPAFGQFGEALALLPDGAIYLTGSAYTTTDAAPDITAVRWRPDGTLEPAFGTGGKVIAPLGSYNDRAQAAVADPITGRLIVAGHMNSGDDAALLARFTAPPPDPVQSPFHGVPFSVSPTPVTLQFEDFDNGGEGIAYHDVDSGNNGGQYRSTGVDISAATDTGGGHYLGFVKTGEWLEYTINVQQAGTYTLDVRLAAASSNGTFHVEVGGVDKTGLLTVPNTGGFQNWTMISRTGVSLPAGVHVLRVFMDTAGGNGSVGNFNWLKLTRQADPIPPWLQPDPGAQYTLDAAALNLTVGSIDLVGDAASTHPGLAVTVAANAVLNIGATQHLASLSLADGALAQLAGGGPVEVLVLGAMTLADTASLDLKETPMIVTYAGGSPIGTWTGSAYTGITGRIASARNAGGAPLWDGPGIGSSAAAGSAGLTTLAVAEAAQVLNFGSAQTTTWNGQTVDTTTVLVRYTFAGDANLDGKINIDDYGRIDSMVGTGATGWFNGDFNYDGKINIDDYGIIDSNISNQAGVVSPTGSAGMVTSATTNSAAIAPQVTAHPAPQRHLSTVDDDAGDELLAELR